MPDRAMLGAQLQMRRVWCDSLPGVPQRASPPAERNAAGHGRGAAEHLEGLARVIRRKPIPRFRLYPQESLRYTTILEGAVRVYPNGREVCQENAAGYREYARRVQVMVQRQGFRCCLCKRRLSAGNATFEHQRKRGMGAAFRDDRIVDSEGNWVNGAAHWICNGERG